MDEILRPLWEGETVYRESVWPVAKKDGAVDIIPLLYRAENIISVQSSCLQRVYAEGRDYVLTDGGLKILPGGSIPVTPYGEFYPDSDDGHTMERTGGGFIFFSEGDVIHRKQLAVTYTHSYVWKGVVPVSYGNTSMKRINDLLFEGRDLRVLFFGDSISTGANSSSVMNCAPFQPSWMDLTVNGLKSMYGYKGEMTVLNTSRGGMSSQWGVETAKENLTACRADLVFIGFGANDAPGGIRARKYADNTRRMIEAARKGCRDCCVVLISSWLMNSECKVWKDTAPALFEYRRELYRLAEAFDRTCVADVTGVSEYILTRKNYRDISGNNVNHPNDFTARMYAQVMLKTIQK